MTDQPKRRPRWRDAATEIVELLGGPVPAPLFALALEQGAPLPLAIGIGHELERRAREAAGPDGAHEAASRLHSAVRRYVSTFEYQRAIAQDLSGRYDLQGERVADCSETERSVATERAQTRDARQRERDLSRAREEAYMKGLAKGRLEAEAAAAEAFERGKAAGIAEAEARRIGPKTLTLRRAG